MRLETVALEVEDPGELRRAVENRLGQRVQVFRGEQLDKLGVSERRGFRIKRVANTNGSTRLA